MRKVFIFTLIMISVCSCFCLGSGKSVYASSNYKRVITSDTPFYSDSNGTELLFYLPYTYYVNVLQEQNGSLCHVECYGENGTAGLDGYVPLSMLYDDGLSVQSPYLSKTITTANTCVLYSDPSLSQAVQYLFKGRELTYYGVMKAHDNGVIFCVGYNGKFGYVKESDVTPFVIENHPNELTFLSQEQVEQTPSIQAPVVQSQPIVFTSLRIIIIACLILAGLIALFFALGKRPPSTQTAFYDENEYE